MANMSETHTHSSEQHDKEFNKATKIAAGFVGAAVLVGVAADHLNRHEADQKLSTSISQESDHAQAVIQEIKSKSNEPLVLDGTHDESLVTLLPPLEDRTLYGVALDSIPKDASDTYSVNYVLASAEALGTYQPDETFALVGDEIDGHKALILKRVEDDNNKDS